MSKAILERAGRYLIVIKFIKADFDPLNESICNMITEECPNLHLVEIGKQRLDMQLLPTLKIIFSKIKKFEVHTMFSVQDENLEELFKLNKRLEHLSIRFHSTIKGTFLNSLPHDTLKELIIINSYVAIDKIHEVSMYFIIIKIDL